MSLFLGIRLSATGWPFPEPNLADKGCPLGNMIGKRDCFFHVILGDFIFADIHEEGEGGGKGRFKCAFDAPIGGGKAAAGVLRHPKPSGGFGLFEDPEVGGAEGAAERGLLGVIILRANGGEKRDEAGAHVPGGEPLPCKGGEGSGASDETEEAREAVDGIEPSGALGEVADIAAEIPQEVPIAGALFLGQFVHGMSPLVGIVADVSPVSWRRMPESLAKRSSAFFVPRGRCGPVETS